MASNGDAEAEEVPSGYSTSILPESRAPWIQEPDEQAPIFPGDPSERPLEEGIDILDNARAQLAHLHGLGERRAKEKASVDSGLLSEMSKVLILIPLYPLTVIQELIQLGYEPVPAQRRYSIVFRRYMYYYPGVYGYAKAIVQQDGWKALYRGAGSCIVRDLVTVAARRVIAPLVAKGVNRLPLSVVEGTTDVPDTEENVETARAVLIRAIRMLIRGIVTQSAVTLVVHPFSVINVRMVAQHIGREQIYTSVWRSIKEIYAEEGIAGFYSGIIPSLLGCAYSTAIYITLWSFFELLAMNAPHAILKLFIKGMIEFPMLAYLPRSYAYPFSLMSTVMAVNNCRLAAGLPPRMPVFNGWLDCYRHLRSSKLLYRGSVVILARYAYTAPPASVM